MMLTKSEWIETTQAAPFGNPHRSLLPAPIPYTHAAAQESWWFLDDEMRLKFIYAFPASAWHLETVVAERLYFVASRLLWGYSAEELMQILKRD